MDTESGIGKSIGDDMGIGAALEAAIDNESRL